MEFLGFCILFSSILCIDYNLFKRSSDSIIFYDKSKIEKDLRKIQEIEIYNKLNYLKEKTCETCNKNIMFECEIFNSLKFGHDEFGCNFWKERK